MTQKEAIIKALQMLGGRASLQDIYPLAMEFGDFSGSKKPQATIRNCLLTSPKQFRHSPGKPDGWWELVSYQEEIASRDRRIAELETLLAAKDGEIAALKQVPTEEQFVKRLLRATENLFGINRKHADYVRQVLLKLCREEEQAELLAWIERRKPQPKTIVQKISNSQVFNGPITESEFNGGGTGNEQ